MLHYKSPNNNNNQVKRECILVVKNKMGIHARPAAMIVRTAHKYNAELYIEKENEQVDGKSIIALMMLAANKGSELKFIIKGEDADALLEELKLLFDNNFDER
jgi:phosphocarrier protein HPr